LAYRERTVTVINHDEVVSGTLIFIEFYVVHNVA